MPINRKTGKSKGIVLVLSQDHVNNELLKLNGIEFKWKQFNSSRGHIPLKKKGTNSDKDSIINDLKLL